MSGPHVLLILFGFLAIAFCTYRLVRYAQTGSMVGMHYARMEARRDQQPIQFWFIVFMNTIWGMLGAVALVTGLAGL